MHHGAMKRVYNALNLPDAHLLRDLLQQAGIAAHVFNENANSLVGFVPVASGQPQVWITQVHQEPHAKAVIADYQSRAATTQTHICAACGESNPGEFDYCWKCGATLAASA
jgi:ribosomal protein L40E